jgi:peptidoglycan/LPS O-acetylase OafA/YrhL
LCVRRVCKPWQLTAGFLLLAMGYVLLTAGLPAIAESARKLAIPVLTPLFSAYADRNALNFFIYFLMGAAVGPHVEDWKRRIMQWRAAWICLYTVCALGLLYQVAAGFLGEHGLHINFDRTLLLQPYMAVFLMLSVIVMSIAAVHFERSAGVAAKRLFTVLGHYSYGAYLAHALTLIAAIYITDRLFPGYNVSLRTIVAFVLCTLLSVLLTVAFSRVRLGRLLTGAPAPLKQDAA